MDAQDLTAPKPCLTCRKRKVKCDKLRPCSNCARAKQTCVYETTSSDVSHIRENTVSVSGDVELRERLARLETLMAKMMVGNGGDTMVSRSNADGGGLSVTGRAVNHYAIVENLTQPHPSSIQGEQCIQHISSGENAPVGQIIFQEGEGAYFNADFWLGLIPEIEDLRRIFDVSGQETTTSPLLAFSSASWSADTSLAHPPIAESDFLLKLFFQIVNPFIRVLHQALFYRDLGKYRNGNYLFPIEFEALLFSLYLLTINSLPSDVVEELFLERKHDLIARYQHGAHVSLTRIKFYQTKIVPGIWALLHYLTVLFQQNLYEDALPLLGILVRQAQAMGYHRDPAHFPYSPWVCEIRRRVWNYICILDAQAITRYGAESCLSGISDAQRPRNASDNQWHASRFTNPAAAPVDIGGVKDMSYVLAEREISELVRMLQRENFGNEDAKRDMLRRKEDAIRERYLQHFDAESPPHVMLKAMLDFRFAELTLPIIHRQTKESGATTSEDNRKYEAFVAALSLLENHEQNTNIFTPHHWSWPFHIQIPFLAVAILLTSPPLRVQETEVVRARHQTSRIFALHAEKQVSRTPLWRILVGLRDRMDAEESSAPLGPGNAEGRLEISMPIAMGIVDDDFMLDFGGDMEFIDTGAGFDGVGILEDGVGRVDALDRDIEWAETTTY